MAKEKRKIEIVLELQNYIETPPATPDQMWGAACSSDTVTIGTWRDIWISNVRKNHQKFGSFKDNGLGKLHGINKNKPAIIIGSGPSLGYNGHELKNKGDIIALSCLHNYHFFEDQDIHIDYYVTLDAGPIVITEVSEGGKKTPEEYWDSTKNKKLLAFIGSDPKLFDLWQGEVYLFNAPIPNAEYQKALSEIEPFNTVISNGGNVLGACLYIAKGIMGSNPIAYMGADFCFSYSDSNHGPRFHAWDSSYDKKIGNVVKCVDIFGNKVLTWPSYFNFKNWFEYIALTVNGIYINCTEGGTLGSYSDGNLMAIKQMTLTDFLAMYNVCDYTKSCCEDPGKPNNLLIF